MPSSAVSLSAIPLVSGLFMIFFSRIWMDDSNSLSPKDLFPKMKPPKGKKKGEKTLYDSSNKASRLLLF